MPTTPNGLESQLLRHWFSPIPQFSWPIRGLLWLVSLLYRLALATVTLAATLSPPKPVHGVRVIAVGNLIVGGAGKTPCVIALAIALKAAGLKCGLVTRGYRSAAEHQRSQVIDPGDLSTRSAADIGDEAWLMCWRTQLPVAVGKNRFQGAQALKRRYPDIDVVLLDDGLQQRSLRVDERLLVLDERGFGNGLCLPAGPLREPIGDLKRFNAWLDSGFSSGSHHARHIDMLPARVGRLRQSNAAWVPLSTWSVPDTWLPVDDGVKRFRGSRLLAVAGIAVPSRFFQTLEDLGIAFDRLPLHDHDPETVARVHEKWATKLYDAVLMTEKDAVKFFNRTPHAIHGWALRRDATLNDDFLTRFPHGPQTP